LNATSSNLELFLLGIFKWVVIAAMLVLIASMIGLVGLGLVQYSSTPVAPEPAKSSSKPTFSSAAFIQSVKPQQADKATPPVKDAQPSTLAVDTGEEVFRVQAERLWMHVNKYQADCALVSPLSKTDFMEALRQTPLKNIIEKRGNDFAASQDAFAKENLANEEIIKLCKSGRGGLFFSLLEFHRSSWDQQTRQAMEFDAQERSRVARVEDSEAARVSARKANSYQLFIGAAIAFGLFMSVALVLIFARLESNLRGVQTIIRTSGATTES